MVSLFAGLEMSTWLRYFSFSELTSHYKDQMKALGCGNETQGSSRAAEGLCLLVCFPLSMLVDEPGTFGRKHTHT